MKNNLIVLSSIVTLFFAVLMSSGCAKEDGKQGTLISPEGNNDLQVETPLELAVLQASDITAKIIIYFGSCSNVGNEAKQVPLVKVEPCPAGSGCTYTPISNEDVNLNIGSYAVVVAFLTATGTPQLPLATACKDVSISAGANSISFSPADYTFSGQPAYAAALVESLEAGMSAKPDWFDYDSDTASNKDELEGGSDPRSQSECSNSIDDDGDTATDFPGDPGCTSLADTSELGTNECDDGSNNDSDGLVDFPDDPGCTDPSDLTETNSAVECDDGVDNATDTDTLADMLDPGCTGPTDTSEIDGECDDKVDSALDTDALVDLADPGCSDTTDTSEIDGECDDKVDSALDTDGLADLADPGCAGDTTNISEIDGECDDMVDSALDTDGLADLADPGCASDTTNISEIDGECDDMVNNDWDGLVDLADQGCTDTDDPSELNSAIECDDGISNDFDGLIDWPDDPGCEGGVTDLTEINPAIECDDGIDNDSDSLTDYPAAPACKSALDTTESWEIGAGVRITNNLAWSYSPSLVWTGTEYGVSWDDKRDGNDEIYFVRIDASGNKIGGDVRITNETAYSHYPSLVWTGTEYGLSWFDSRDGNDEIYFMRIDASGNKIGADVRITNDINTSVGGSLVWTGSEYGVSWRDERDGNREIYFARIDASGNKIGGDVRITNATSSSESPSLVWAGTEYGLSWMDERDGNLEVYFARIDASGNKIGSEVRITNAANGSYTSPHSLVWTGSEYGVSFEGKRDGSEIYFALIDASGNKIGGDVRVTNATGFSQNPSLVWTGTEYGVSWRDERDGNFEIYFTRIY